MAAPMVNPRASTLRGKKGNKNYFPVKNTVTSPFLSEWPQLSHEDAELILQKIKSTFMPHAARLAKTPSKGRRKVVPDDEAKHQRAFLRSQLALGVNEVTRSLEQGKLRLALVCASAQPALMTSHLMSLSATRNTPVLCLKRLSATLAPILNLKVILAIGFKKTTNDDPTTFDDLVNFIVAMTPPIHVPWLKYKELSPHELRQVVTNTILTAKACGKSAGKQKGKNKGQKKGQGSSGVQAPDHAQAGTSSGQVDRNPDSGANAEVPQNQVAPEHVQCVDVGNQGVSSDASEQLLCSSEQSKPQNRPTVKLGRTASMPSDSPIPGKKRKLSGTAEGPSKARAKTVLKPDYKPVTVLPVKIIPKDMKGKKQLKKERKKNKKKTK